MENASASTTSQHVENRVETTPFNPRATFDLDAIESLRQKQHEAYQHAFDLNTQEGFSPETAEFYAKNTTNAIIDQYLEANGLERDDEQYNVYHKALSEVSINNVKDEDWAATYEEGTTEQGQSGRDKVRALYTDLTGKGYYDTDASELETEKIATIEEADPAIEAARTHLAGLRETLATLNAKRQGRIFGDGGVKYQTALAEYNEQVIKAGKIETADVLADETLTEEEKNLEVIKYLFEEQQKLREASLESLKGTKVHKFIEWMNKGNVAVRVAKGIALGAGAAVVGAGIGAVAGVAGVTAIGAGVAATTVGAVRFARGFARSDAKKGRGMQQLDATSDHEEAKQLSVEDGADYFEAVQSHYNDKFEADTDKEQSKRRRSVAAGAIGIALGAGIGTAAHIAADAGIFDGWLNRGPLLPFSDNTVGAEGEPEVPSKEIDTPIEPTPEVTETPDTPEAPVDSGPEIIADPQFAIGSGEGGIHFFQRLGLSEADWYSVHEELRNNFPGDFYSESGDTRLAHPGQLSLEAQQYIKQRFGLA